MENRDLFAVPIWDAHVHAWPAEVIRDPAGWAREHREPHWGRLVSEGPQGWADADGLLRAMDRDGIEKVILQGWYWERPENALRQNEWHAAWRTRYPDRFLAFAAWHPRLPDPLAVLEEARQWGACGVGECLPQVQSPAAWEDPAWQVLLEWTTRQGWPVCLHLTETVGHEYPGRVPTCLQETLKAFAAHPGQNWIAAHWGGGLPFYALNRRVARVLQRVWFDTAASPLLYDARVWSIVCQLVGPGRILFGSDFPLLLRPRLQDQPGWGPLLREFRGSVADSAQQAAILRDNLADLLGQSGQSGFDPA